MQIMSAIPANLQAIQTRMREFLRDGRRKADSARLVAVSKMQPVEAVLIAAEAGQRDFGESYVQEAIPKIMALQAQFVTDPLVWHFIGALQGNKTRLVAEHFDWVHSVDRLKIAERLSAQRPAHLPPLNVTLEVDISGEAGKKGVSPEELPGLARAVAGLPRLLLRGLMCIPAPAAGLSAQRAPFRQLFECCARLRSEGLMLDTLSMGMSHDFPAALMEGSTLVRIGTAIFGERK
jgi:pyridoxal phosphate enzyme (YggS family)